MRLDEFILRYLEKGGSKEPLNLGYIYKKIPTPYDSSREVRRIITEIRAVGNEVQIYRKDWVSTLELLEREIRLWKLRAFGESSHLSHGKGVAIRRDFVRGFEVYDIETKNGITYLVLRSQR